jgi:hypothetical protein
MSSICNIPVSIGELWDKYTILLIKKDNIIANEKLIHINNELEQLKLLILEYPINDTITNELLLCNKKLWDIEDKIRIKEYKKEFDNEFIELARAVYFTNDERASIKKQISILYNSNIMEVKSYVNYN